MEVKNVEKNTILASRCKLAGNFFKRFMGLMGRKHLDTGEALLITPCNSIHMFFMKFSLDVIFLDENNTIVYLLEGIRPWSVSPLIKEACSVLELPAGTIKATGSETGDRLVIENI
jgi:uncharacterized membrane protein (UPF0127 family)